MAKNLKARPAVVKLSDLQEHDNFKMFDQDTETIAAIASNIKTYGYDPARPMVVAEGPWTKGKKILVEGYQRKSAHEKAGFEDAQVVIRYSKTEQDALDYALKEQFDRRNSGDKELFRAIQAADDRSKAGRPRKICISLMQISEAGHLPKRLKDLVLPRPRWKRRERS